MPDEKGSRPPSEDSPAPEESGGPERQEGSVEPGPGPAAAPTESPKSPDAGRPDGESLSGLLAQRMRAWWENERTYVVLLAVSWVVIAGIVNLPFARELGGRFAQLMRGVEREEDIGAREKRLAEALRGKRPAAAPAHSRVFAVADGIASMAVPAFLAGLVGCAILVLGIVFSREARVRVGLSRSGRAPDSPFRLWDLVWSFFVFEMLVLCLQMIVASASLYPTAWRPEDDWRAVVLPIAGQVVAEAIVVALLFSKVMARGAGPGHLGFAGGDPVFRGAAVGAGVFVMSFWAIQFFGHLGKVLWQQWSGEAPQPHPVVPMLLGDRDVAEVLFVVLVTVAAAPILEEIFFRGVVYGSLSRWVPRWSAAILQAGIFALVHHSGSQFLPIFLMGLILAFLFERTGTLFAPIAFHALNNLMSMSQVVRLWAYGP